MPDMKTSPADTCSEDSTTNESFMNPVPQTEVLPVPSRSAAFYEKAWEASRLEKSADRFAVLWALGLVGAEAAFFLLVENRFFKLAYMLLVFLLFIPLSLIGNKTRLSADSMKESIGLHPDKSVAEQVPELKNKYKDQHISSK